MSRRIMRLGGTTLPTRFMVKMYCAIGIVGRGWANVQRAAPGPGIDRGQTETRDPSTPQACLRGRHRRDRRG
jgi:hypothetical protein